MRFKLSLLMLFLLLLNLFLTGCMKEKEICNYDAICSEEETDNCADCKNVLGRDVAEPTTQEGYVESPLGIVQ